MGDLKLRGFIFSPTKLYQELKIIRNSNKIINNTLERKLKRNDELCNCILKPYVGLKGGTVNENLHAEVKEIFQKRYCCSF